MYRPMMMPHVNGALSGKLPAVQQPKDPIRDSESLHIDHGNLSHRSIDGNDA